MTGTGTTPGSSLVVVTEYEVVYWPTERICVTYDTREEAVEAVAWYEKTYGPFEGEHIGIREVIRG